uniref:Uncharacterized protein n=1 Tax=Globodera rostochiensis TaxID=31243 RepID=A0A914I1I6_GLORO
MGAHDWAPARLGGARLGAARLGAARLGAHDWARHDWAPARLGAARLGAHDWARHDWARTIGRRHDWEQNNAVSTINYLYDESKVVLPMNSVTSTSKAWHMVANALHNFKKNMKKNSIDEPFNTMKEYYPQIVTEMSVKCNDFVQKNWDLLLNRLQFRHQTQEQLMKLCYFAKSSVFVKGIYEQLKAGEEMHNAVSEMTIPEVQISFAPMAKEIALALLLSALKAYQISGKISKIVQIWADIGIFA